MRVEVSEAAAEAIATERAYLKKTHPSSVPQFNGELRTLYRQLAGFPESGEAYGAGFQKARRALLGHFKYALTYQTRGEIVVVVEFYHTAQDRECSRSAEIGPSRDRSRGRSLER